MNQVVLPQIICRSPEDIAGLWGPLLKLRFEKIAGKIPKLAHPRSFRIRNDKRTDIQVLQIPVDNFNASFGIDNFLRWWWVVGLSSKGFGFKYG